MNIDVREYLRINPISVHESTLSDSDNDCFLFFNENGYVLKTQGTMFDSIRAAIFNSDSAFENYATVAEWEV